MPPKTASELKEQGNEKFKRRLYKEAAELYRKAESIAPREAVYPSNLSAAHYELGDYAASLQAIQRAFENIPSTEDVSPLAIRLSTRLAKVLSHGVRDGSISSEMLKDTSEMLSRISTLAENPDFGQELGAAWKDWRRVESEKERVSRGAAGAKAHLSSLPILRKSANPGIEYFSIGHDNPMSIIDDWGPDVPDPMNLKSLPPSHLSNLSFLFGGVGDARHVFSSIIGLHRAYGRLARDKQSHLNTHLTLLDIHPTALARDLCIFFLLDELILDESDEEAKTETLATLFYVFLGVVIPPYCYEKFRGVVRIALATLQQSPPKLPAWVHVTANAIPSILDALRLWDAEIAGKTTEGMLQNHQEDVAELLQHASELIHEPITVPQGLDPDNVDYKALAALSIHVHQTPDEEVIRHLAPRIGPCPGLNVPRERKLWLKDAREMMLGAMLLASQASGDSADSTPKELKKENSWYDDMSVYVPPGSLRKRHPAFDELWAKVNARKPGTTGNIKGLVQKARTHVLDDWKPNPTLFDRVMAESEFYPLTKFKIIGSVVTQIFEFNDRFGLAASKEDMNDSPCYTTAKVFFTAVANGIKALQGRIKLEVLKGDLIYELASMTLSADHHRPEEFPRAYTRMWLSNVPDYTHGLLNMVLFAAPGLEDVPGAMVAANCLLNSPVWKNDAQFCHQYTLLLPAQVPKFLGCRLVQAGPHKLTKLSRLPTPLPLTQLASHDELKTWLCRVLFSTLISGRTSFGQMDRIHTPNNLTAFIVLVLHLHSVGFPSHWLSGFLSSVLANNLVSDVAPYQGDYPTPTSEHSRRVTQRKVNLEPWHADLEHILVTAYDALPFPIALPQDFASSEADIATYEVEIPAHNVSPAAGLDSHQQTYPVVSLLFYNSRTLYSADDFAENMHSLLEGTFKASADVQIITTIQSLDLTKTSGCCRVSWRMARARTAKMAREGWVMAPFRQDIRRSLLWQPVPAVQWKEQTLEA
ncbi:hypothetical protein EIP91_005901 [Steccherinum ochraceum]|uniref:DUF4470 domain-containing protein n=1 Tax=Steccherinum ochraceum TaxID=92696 RepID=A0A4R0R6S8_9APHY|nr:hypothetical protein EIP91_005901 [Steccherinum ochraceum]